MYLVVLCIIIVLYLIKRPLYHSSLKIIGNQHIKYDKLMIVAHPDDELIFGGAELISKSGWKVVVVTNCTQESSNMFSLYIPNRLQEFMNIMNKLGHCYEIWDYEDNGINCNWDNKIETDIRNLLDNNKFKMIVTHNLKGEYGHIQHKKLSQIMHKLVNENLYVFTTSKNINPYYKKVKEILKLYTSQNSAINTHDKYTLYQCIVRVK